MCIPVTSPLEAEAVGRRLQVCAQVVAPRQRGVLCGQLLLLLVFPLHLGTCLRVFLHGCANPPLPPDLGFTALSSVFNLCALLIIAFFN